ncbi:hypothetical protein GYMLUDRAFT_44693 [Collybiopsis luxurians FD-317 M1]|uniref:Ribosome assembly protein 1 n=1 Tax=Collybiopsis luxurians FD-317 M1 TaxID=944289 RepID=A0A0D0BUY8_9AGAR|nr:hypothetical protein GYMLUDRAFT_44693 [Collybiopsis luxurians FD-317 M1]
MAASPSPNPSELTQNTLLIRNLTTLGHVDHGKTTLMDSLLASNNIISSRMAGKIRYMDSREDEQERGITMEASAVGLKYRIKAQTGDGATSYILNMIDTPGHVDFSSEVSSSSRLCDGALVLVDVIEGVSTQTRNVLRQAYQDQLTPVLVLNKVDRMITEVKFTPEEAYERLSRVIEDVNVVMGDLWGGERMKRADLEGDDEKAQDRMQEGNGDADEDDSSIYFDPTKGNVIFASAIDGWGFRPSHFARIFAKKLFADQLKEGKLTNEGLREKEESLKKVMWGEWYFEPKTRRVVGPKGKKPGMKPLFVQIVLDNLWKVYDAVVGNPDPDKVLKIISTLSLTLPPRELKSLSNLTSPSSSTDANNPQATYSKHLLSLIFSSWLPLSTCIVQTVIDIVPPPGAAQGRRMGRMLGIESSNPTSEPASSSSSGSGADTSSLLYHHLYTASPSSSVPVCAYVSKMFAVRKGDLPEEKERARTEKLKDAKVERERRDRERAAAMNTSLGGGVDSEAERGSAALTDGQNAVEEKTETETETETKENGGGKGQDDADDDVLLGFARIYSGTLGVGEQVLVLLPKFNPALEASSTSQTAVTNATSDMASLSLGGTVSSSSPDVSNTSVHPSNASYTLGLSPTPVTIQSLYLMMGRELLPAKRVSAGQIFAVRLAYGSSSSPAATPPVASVAVGEDGAAGEENGIAGMAKAVATELTKDGEEIVAWRSGTIVRPGLSAEEEGERGKGAGSGKKEQWMVNLGRVNQIAPPIVRVALLPAHPGDLPAVLRGLKILEQADPCVEAFQMVGGEWVIGGAGELHLERCLKDLRERYAKVEIHASKPIVPFRETAVREISSDPQQSGAGQASAQQRQQHQQQKQFQAQFGTASTGGPTGTISSSSSPQPNGIIQFTLRAVPLPYDIREFLAGKRRRGVLGRLKRLQAQQNKGKEKENSKPEPQSLILSDEERAFWAEFTSVCEKAASKNSQRKEGERDKEAFLWKDLAERVWAFGPLGSARGLGAAANEDDGADLNDLDGDDESEFVGGMDAYGAGCVLVDSRGPSSISTAESGGDKFDPLPYILSGFHLAVRQGPLCAEPVEGLAYFVQRVDVDWERLTVEIEQNRLSQTTGSLISAFRDACQSALLEWSPRLMLAMYSCDIQCSTDVLGRVYAVVSKRKGRIVAEEMNEGTSFFTITARLPVVESFGFADELRKRTSGAAGAMLVFSGYDLLPLSPFWVPTTTEELEDLGVTADRANEAKAYMDAVRERKGMFVDRKIVEHAEKQRTLKK